MCSSYSLMSLWSQLDITPVTVLHQSCSNRITIRSEADIPSHDPLIDSLVQGYICFAGVIQEV